MSTFLWIPLIISTFSCTFEEFKKEITEIFFGCLVKEFLSDYEFVKVKGHKDQTLESDEDKEFDKRNNFKDTVLYSWSYWISKFSGGWRDRFYWENQWKL